MNKFIKTIFYGNIFYGFCTVALSLESNLQHDVSLNSPRFYVLTFLATIVYYSRIYYRSSAIINVDERTKWYRNNRPAIKIFLIVSSIAIVADILLMLFINRKVLISLPAFYWGLLMIVPLLGIMYTYQLQPLKTLRNVGWLKPFVIGFVWAGIVTIFPILFWQVRNPGAPQPDIILKSLLWLQNFLFISTLAIVFDIKDYNADKKHKLKTYPAAFGIKNCIRFVIIPFTILSFLVLLFFQYKYQKPFAHTIIQSIPYLILLILSKSLAKERKLLFYLAAIDGLMLLKAITGIISILLF